MIDNHEDNATDSTNDSSVDSSVNRPFYIAVWRHVLIDWLHWPNERFNRWISLHDADLDDRGSAWFYHEGALTYITRFLIPDRLTRNLGGSCSERLTWQLESVIGTWNEVERNAAFDWDAARERVMAVLSEYGETLAGPEDHLDYLRRRLGPDCS
ncbi:MAG: hypothetical protein ABI353_07690 [Isosphaeraceae bacterium]